MKKTVNIFVIGIIAVTGLMFGPLIYREYPPDKFEISTYNYLLLPNFDFHVRKNDEIVLRNAEAALKNNFFIGTPSVNFPPIKAELVDLWHNRQLSSSNSHELFIHSLFIVWDLFYAYKITDDSQYIDKAKEIIISWIANNNRWRITTSQYVWNDHAVSERTILILYFWDYIKEKGMSDLNFDAFIRKYIIQATNYLINPQNYITGHNHGIFEDITLLLISYHISSEEKANYYANISLKRFLKQIEFSFSENSIHLENSPGYHFVVTNLAQYYLDLAKLEMDLPEELTNKIESAQSMKGFFLMPDGSLPPVGDTNPDDLIKDSPRKINSAIADSLAGYFIASTSNQYLLARSTGISKVHSHDDPLSFIYSSEDGLIIDETGFLSYENTADKNYTKSYLAHNGIYPSLQEPEFEKQAFIRKLSINDSIYCCQLELKTVYGSIERTFVLNDRKNSLDIYDFPLSEELNKWTTTFILNYELDSIIQIDSTHIDVTLNNNSYRISSSTPLKILSAKDVPKIGWRAQTLDKLYPSYTIVRIIENNRSSRFTIQKTAENLILDPSKNNSLNHIKFTDFQKADHVDQRAKTLWGTQFYRRIQIYQKIIILLVLSFLAVIIISSIKFLRKFIYLIAVIPNLLAFAAVLYLVLRHIN